MYHGIAYFVFLLVTAFLFFGDFSLFSFLFLLLIPFSRSDTFSSVLSDQFLAIISEFLRLEHISHSVLALCDDRRDYFQADLDCFAALSSCAWSSSVIASRVSSLSSLWKVLLAISVIYVSPWLKNVRRAALLPKLAGGNWARPWAEAPTVSSVTLRSNVAHIRHQHTSASPRILPATRLPVKSCQLYIIQEVREGLGMR